MAVTVRIRSVFVACVLFCLTMPSSAQLISEKIAPYAQVLLENGHELDELQNRELIVSVIARAFANRDYDSLEQLAVQFRDKKLKTSSGVPKSGRYYRAFKDILYCAERCESVGFEVEQRINEWQEKYPNSTAVRIVHAEMLLQRGWAIRGRGFVNTVKPESWKPFLGYVESARNYLNDNEQFRNDDPNWDTTLLDIAKTQSISDVEFDAMSEAALNRNPDHYEIYFSIAEKYAPKWGGSPDAIENFARDAVVRTQSFDGNSMYARIYWLASQSQFGENLFNSSSVSWQQMKLGIEDVLKKYPDKWNIYNFAMFACFASDKEKAKELLSRISHEQFNKSWPHFQHLENCRAYAGVN